MEPQKRIQDLTALLNEAGYRYYVLDDPTLPDFEYDRLLRELEDLEKTYPEYVLPDSPTKPRISPRCSSKLTSCSTCCRFLRPTVPEGRYHTFRSRTCKTRSSLIASGGWGWRQ